MRTSRKPSQSATQFIKVKTVPPVGSIDGTQMVKSHLIWWMHRYENQAIPCMAPNCLFDLAEIPGDQRIYLPMRDSHAKTEFLLDLPCSAHGPLSTAYEQHGDLRKLVFRFGRIRAGKNAAITVTSACLTSERPRLEFEFDVEAALSSITAKAVTYATGQILAKNPSLRGSILTAERPAT